MEEFQALLERIFITINNRESLQDQSLNLSAKEKLTERDVPAYKYCLTYYARKDCFELVDWVELRVQVMAETREETEGFDKKTGERRNKNRYKRPRFRGFNKRSSGRNCIVIAHVNKTIHHGSVTLSRSFLYRRERNQFQRPAVVIGAWQLGITAKIVVKQENVELTDARTTTIAVIFMKATHKMETQILDNIYKLGH